MTQVLPALAAMLAAQILTSMAVAGGPVLAPLAAPDLGVEAHLVGTYISLIYAVAAAAGLVSGGFIARYGALRVTQTCLALSAAGLVLGALATPAAVVAAALVLGCASGPTTPASSHVLARVTPPQSLNAVFSARQTGVPLGGALAGIAMPAVAVAFGWQAAVLAGAVLCLGLAVLLQPWRRPFDAARDRDRQPLSLAQFVGPLGIVFGTPGLRPLMVVGFVYSGVQNCFATFLTTYLHDRLGMSVVRAGFVLMLGLTFGAVGRIVWGAITDRFVEARRMLGALGIGMSLCCLLTASFTAAWPFGLVVAVCCSFGATTIAWNGVFLAQVARLAPSGRVGEATGGATFVSFVGVVALPGIFTLELALTESYALGFAAAAALTLGGGLWLLARRTESPAGAATRGPGA